MLKERGSLGGIRENTNRSDQWRVFKDKRGELI